MNVYLDMRYKVDKRGGWGMLVALVAITFCTAHSYAQQPAKKLPPFPEVVSTAETVLDRQTDYCDGDILTRSQVEPIFAELESIGFEVSDRKEILAQVPSDNDQLVSMLHTPSGMKFMRRVSSMPNAYDRLDRLLLMPIGPQTIRDLIRGPGGDEMIRYMTTTPGGNALGQQLSNAPTGANFNEPTGRIYTAKLLFARLKKSYTEAEKKLGNTPSD
jgi:hypothetical protein